jgi:hypothetical protein
VPPSPSRAAKACARTRLTCTSPRPGRWACRPGT